MNRPDGYRSSRDRPIRRPPTRRAVLRGTAVSASATLAGCLGGPSGGDTPSPEGTSLRNHPGTAGLADQPTIGPDPFEAEAVIVAFEDPSCPRCRTFEQQTVPKIESELVDPGLAAFVFRGYPVVYPWGEPATHALEATYARDEDAFWALAAHYFDQQASFSASNVLDRTRKFLAEGTDLDADGVVADARTGAYESAVQTDLSAGMNAGAGRTTPTVLLFKDGRYRTRAAGSVSFSVVKSALDV